MFFKIYHNIIRFIRYIDLLLYLIVFLNELEDSNLVRIDKHL